MNSKPEIVFTLPACMGGVTSFNHNIINYSRLIKNYKSKVILLTTEEDKRPLFTEAFKADETVMFHYSHKENQYKVQERLNNLLSSAEGVIVTDNSITVQSAVRFNNPKTIFYLLHDFYYVEENIRMGNMADACIAHSSFFSDAVFASNPDEFVGRSFYIPYGVPQIDKLPVKSTGSNLNLVFLGRLAPSKGVTMLYSIDELLQAQGIHVNWTIIGKGPLKEELLKQWSQKQNVSFCEPPTMEEVYSILSKQDVFVFPTSFEGTPVSILESLANGVVTIANDLPGGIRDILKDGIGYRCPLNDLPSFVQHISHLDKNRDVLQQMQLNCFNLSRSNYDITKNADDYFTCFGRYKELKRPSKRKAPVLSRLDKPYLPDSLVRMLRK